MRPTLLALVLVAAPVQADERVNADQVLACLNAERSAAACAATLMAPCAHMQAAGFLRACAYRLRLRWQEMLDRDLARLVAALPAERAENLAAEARHWPDLLERRCAADPQAGPASASIRRNTCRIGLIASLWAGLVRESPDLLDRTGSR